MQYYEGHSSVIGTFSSAANLAEGWRTNVRFSLYKTHNPRTEEEERRCGIRRYRRRHELAGCGVFRFVRRDSRVPRVTDRKFVGKWLAGKVRHATCGRGYNQLFSIVTILRPTRLVIFAPFCQQFSTSLFSLFRWDVGVRDHRWWQMHVEDSKQTNTSCWQLPCSCARYSQRLNNAAWIKTISDVVSQVERRRCKLLREVFLFHTGGTHQATANKWSTR